jgi:putative ABC transport system ATP-binding protein
MSCIRYGLLDSPTEARYWLNGALVMDLLQGLHEAGATICMVTHDPRYAHRATRTIHLFDGRLVDEAEA